jgi:uncharacterized protein YdaU (DUF1376 family)
VNYYEHHLGDYAKDTGHLSMLEHGAYRILLDRYYSTEAGIPAAQAYRLARARSEEERQAVDVVLEEFFERVDGVWINRRAEEEIAKERKKQSDLKSLRERDEYRRFRDLVLDRDGHTCVYCGAFSVPLQLDHVIPRSRGGVDTPDNLVACCKPCNTSKGAPTPDEWGARNG